MRHILSAALVALVVGALAGATVSALAQSEPATVAPAAVSSINADRVDGKHAVGANASPQQRRNKLVATNSQGLLPANIVKPPWNRIQGIPAGFADGMDNTGVARVTLTYVSSTSVSIPAGGTSGVLVYCPAGSKVTGGGLANGFTQVRQNGSYPLGTSGWVSYATNTATTSLAVSTYALCLSTTPASGLAVASREVKGQRVQ